ncbi:MAG: CarD family transcriptional regulator [Candidatus Babeliaceae bacterium]|jgi:CarD family transcriptional regulator
MFALHEKVVYPGHGVAQISRIFKQNIAGNNTLFYELTFLNKDVTILVPTSNVDAVGIRPLTSQENISAVLNIISQPARKMNSYDFTASSWNKRNKEYQLKLRTGSLKALLEIYRDLKLIETYKELSFGEKNLLQQTEGLLVEEISLVQKLGQDKAIEQLRSLCPSKNRYSIINEHIS